jgi:hypothetical protein
MIEKNYVLLNDEELTKILNLKVKDGEMLMIYPVGKYKTLFFVKKIDEEE